MVARYTVYRQKVDRLLSSDAQWQDVQEVVKASRGSGIWISITAECMGGPRKGKHC